MKRLEGQIAIVTGAGTGIGASTAKLLASEGAQVVVVGRRKALLDAVVAEIERSGGKAVARSSDLARPKDAAAVGEWAVGEFGRVDVLVNNAGASSKVRNIQWVGLDDWDQVLGVNLTGVFALTQSVLPIMVKQGHGSIVTISSAAARNPGLLGGAPYGAAKAAVANLMGHVHQVLRNTGVRATTIFPAEVDTPILENRPLVPDAKARETMMRPEDIAQAVLFCLTLPPRTVVEELVISPTRTRDSSADLRAARDQGER